MRAIKLEVREFAMLIAFRNAGRGNERISARFKAAIAAYNPAIRIRRLPPTSTTNGTNFRGNLHEQSLKRVSTLNVHCANRFAQVHKGGSPVYILWSYGKFVENREDRGLRAHVYAGNFYFVRERLSLLLFFPSGLCFAKSRTTCRNDCACAR